MTAADCANLAKDHGVWLLVGFLGQAMFSGRFIVQWLMSEKLKRSVIPNLFWWFSIAGGSVLLVYALHRADPVFIVGQAAGLFIYLRNLYLIYRAPKKSADDPASSPL